MCIFYLVLLLSIALIFTSMKKQDKEIVLEKDSTIFVRGLAITFIMLHHLVQRTVATDKYTWRLTWIGFIMVGVFFLLSGYGNTFSIKKNKSIKWLIKRILRLVVTFWFIYAIYLIALAIFKGETLTIKEILIGAVTLTMPYYTIWYLKVQILAYILIFISYRAFKKHNDLIVLTLVIITVVIMYFSGLYPYWWNSILCFAVGCVFAERKNIVIDIIKRTNKFIVIPLSIIAFLLLFYIGNRHTEVTAIVSISFCVVITIILFFYKFKSVIINFLGNISLEIYLWHLVFIILLFDKGKNIINLNVNLLLFFIASIGVAYITNKLINRIMKKIIK